MEPSLAHLLTVVFAGGLSGLLSGLLGVTPGGILVPSLVLLGACSQHQAQAISLAAQLLPTSLAGLRPYWQGGHRIAARWLLWLAAGFVPGTYLGARGANLLSDGALRWTFVGYLAVLLAVSLRRRGESADAPAPERQGPHPALLLFIGVLAGASSGLLGIGGGLASIALLTTLAGLGQHAAQALSLALAALPLALPAVYVYASGAVGIPWLDAGLVVAGLLAGTYAGASLATRLSGTAMRRYFVALVGLMLVLMIVTAL